MVMQAVFSWTARGNKARLLCRGVLLTLLLALVRGACAESSVTAYGGYVVGGSVTDSITGQTLDVLDAPSYALALDFGLDPRSQVQVFFNHQQTHLQASAFVPGNPQIGLGISYLQLGGTYFIDGIGHGVYVMGGVGVTYMSPSVSDLSSETRLSLNVGLGYMIPLGKHLGIRFEARGYATLLNNDGGIFCGSNKGCVITINGQGFYQGEGLVGLAVRF
jgi:hypothetical protein